MKSIDVQKIAKRRYALDVRNQVCPYPELLTLRALQGLPSKSILEVVLNNPPSVRDIPISLEKRGYEKPEVVRIDEGAWKIIVQITKQ